MNSLCTTAWRSKKNYQHGPDADHLEFQFLRPRGCLTNPFRTPSLCYGITAKTPGFISRNNFFFLNFVCIGYRDNVLAGRDSIFPLLMCQEVLNKRAHNFLFSKSSFRIRRTIALWIFKDSAIILDAIRWSFSTKSVTASNVYLSSSRFWTPTSLVIFYQIPSVSKSRISSKNVWSVHSLIPISLLHQH